MHGAKHVTAMEYYMKRLALIAAVIVLAACSAKEEAAPVDAMSNAAMTDSAMRADSMMKADSMMRADSIMRDTMMMMGDTTHK